MKRVILAIAVALVGGTIALLDACSPQAPAASTGKNTTISISDAWIQMPMPGAKVAAGYLTITNGGGEDKLLSVSSPRAGKIELHEMKMDGGMMSMRPITGGVTIPAGGSYELSPASTHLMFSDMAQPLVGGEAVPLTLTFEHAGAVETTAPVSAAHP